MAITERQAQILELAAGGASDKEIARTLELSVHTIRTHLQRLYASEGYSNRAEAVAAWVTSRSTEADPAPVAPVPAGRGAPSLLHWRIPVWRVAAGIGVVAFFAVALPASRVLVDAAPAGRAGTCATCTPPAAAAHAAGSPGSAPTAPAATAAATPTPTTPAASPSPAVTPPASGPTLPPPAVATQVTPATGLLSTINQDRAAAGLPPLAWNDCLLGVAEGQAQRMAAQGFVSKGDGTTQDAGCHLTTPAGLPPAEVLTYWSGVNDAQVNAVILGDPAQRAAVLGPYRALGAAWSISPSGVAYLALELS